ncbi:NUDIX domain-containing protein [Streptomyces sp. NPDC006610]|uniref:NUDIX domain-containing protein n=1 Tax=Streptomyces sp. NPDC006610 TaxID=3154584 RepID=UPI00339EBC5C
MEAGDRTLLAAAVREVCEEAGIRPGDLCLIPQFLDAPIDVDLHDINANPANGEPATSSSISASSSTSRPHSRRRRHCRMKTSPTRSGSRSPMCAPLRCGPNSWTSRRRASTDSLSPSTPAP